MRFLLPVFFVILVLTDEQCVDRACVICERGYYKNERCVKCPEDTTNFFVGATSRDDCILAPPLQEYFTVKDKNCPLGTENILSKYCKACSSVCPECPPKFGTLISDYQCPDFTERVTNPVEGCKPCLNGTVMFNKNQMFCEKCRHPDGICSEREFKEEDCLPGTHWNKKYLQCIPCGYSSFNVLNEFAETVILIAQHFLDDCPPGSEYSELNDGNRRCIACAQHHYRDGKTRLCIQCPKGFGTFQPGSTKIEHCNRPLASNMSLPKTAEGCPKGYEIQSDKCVPCPKNMFKSSQLDDSNCQPCPENTIALYVGSSSCQELIQIISFSPNSTRKADTIINIKIKGSFSVQYILNRITIAEQPCFTNVLRIFERTELICTVRHSPEPVSGPLKLMLNDEIVVESKDIFSFLTVPKIESIDREKTFESGGLIASVKGFDFNSTNPLMIIRMVEGNFTTNCTLDSDTLLECILPRLPKGKGNIGVLFDEVDYYSDFQSLTVLNDPRLKVFERDLYELEAYKKFAIFNGTNLNSAKISDYKIQIGSEECKIGSLSSSSITCNVLEFDVNIQYNVTVKCADFSWSLGFLKKVAKPDDSSENDDNVNLIIIILSTFRRKKQTKLIKRESKWKLPSIGTKRKRNYDDYLIDFDQLSIQYDIEQGFFGKLSKAIFFPPHQIKMVNVHIKCLYGDNVTPIDVSEFLEEAMTFSNVSNDYILSPIALTYDSLRKPFVLFPAANNLKNFLVRFGSTLSLNDLLFVANQVLEGLNILYQKYGILHGDIACRNCVISHNLTTQIADNCLSKDLYRSDYGILPACGNRSVPIRWMAPELFVDYKITLWSELWSAAVLIWEVLTNGETPYYKIDTLDVPHHVLQGQVLEQPAFCPREVYELLKCSFSKEITDRPSWKNLQATLTRFRY
ncbi:DgyrCDS8258 [Dimorphilus gyrociliatus]|uniref:DgyrCDS8258 n=1 Tax=Dimorphilus gyrociliatus TaxID=2664684 RepID=A0A7I8VTM1_9ANNE|nr:DgyrCDS8258 [Dimorphilus gyrociliatus]